MSGQQSGGGGCKRTEGSADSRGEVTGCTATAVFNSPRGRESEGGRDSGIMARFSDPSPRRARPCQCLHEMRRARLVHVHVKGREGKMHNCHLPCLHGIY